MTLQRELEIILLQLENIRDRCKYLNDQERIDDVTKQLRALSWKIEEMK